MADVLSQSQIDELLKSMQGGGGSAKAEEKPAPTEQTKKQESPVAVAEKSQKQQKPEIKYNKYDFYSPRKFTKDT